MAKNATVAMNDISVVVIAFGTGRPTRFIAYTMIGDAPAWPGVT